MATLSGVEHGLAEDTPLLSPSIHTVDSHTEPTDALRERPSQLRILTILFLYVLILNLGFELILPAQTRVFEAIYCKGYYEEHEPGLIGSDGGDGIDEKWCKVGVIQGEVAMLKGWQVTFDGIGSTRLKIPTFPSEADKFNSSAYFFRTLGLFCRFIWAQTGDTPTQHRNLDQICLHSAHLLVWRGYSAQAGMAFCDPYGLGRQCLCWGRSNIHYDYRCCS